MTKYNFNLIFKSGKFEIQIDTKARYGYFEHEELGDECAGGLWFDGGKILIDADGTSCLPKRVIEGLVEQGYCVPSEFI